MLPEFVLYRLSGRRVAEYTNATHTGLVNLKTGDWDAELFKSLGLPLEAAPPIVPTGTVLGTITGKLVQLEAFRDTQIIAPATHDTASAIAGIPTDLSSAAYISSGTWSLVGTITQSPVTTKHAFDAGYTNIGAAAGGLLFHSLINSMWVLKQCMDAWAAQGRPWSIESLILEAAARSAARGVLDMDAEALMLDGEMPRRINAELTRQGFDAIPDVAGNEPLFARTIFESLALRYAAATANLEKMLGRKLEAHPHDRRRHAQQIVGRVDRAADRPAGRDWRDGEFDHWQPGRPIGGERGRGRTRYDGRDSRMGGEAFK